MRSTEYIIFIIFLTSKIGNKIMCFTRFAHNTLKATTERKKKKRSEKCETKYTHQSRVDRRKIRVMISVRYTGAVVDLETSRYRRHAEAE